MTPEQTEEMFKKEIGKLSQDDKEVLDANRKFEKASKNISSLSGANVVSV